MVSTATDWWPAVWPGVATMRTPGRTSWSPGVGRMSAPSKSTHSRIVWSVVVGQPPFDRLDEDRDVREREVLAGVIGMQVAVDDSGHVGWSDVDAGERIEDPLGADVIRLVELGVAEAEPGVNDDHALGMVDRESHDHPTAALELRLGKPEGAELVGVDGQVHATPVDG